ncbi:hypothetical protein [uncultured Gammaproteobacteria bacterium]|nr:hypothetical protein [uncultured Gammaproteobacteria bacterium]
MTILPKKYYIGKVCAIIPVENSNTYLTLMPNFFTAHLHTQ